MDDQNLPEVTNITVNAQKEKIDISSLLRWLPLAIVVIVAYLGSAFVYKIFPFGKVRVDLSHFTRVAGLALPEESNSEITIAKTASPSGIKMYEIAGADEKLALNLPDDYVVNTELGDLIKNIDRSKITTVVNEGYNQSRLNETWSRKLILLQDYGENKAATLAQARTQVLDSLKSNDGSAVAEYKTVSASGLVALKRTHEEKATEPYLVTEYFIFTSKNIYGISEYSWKKTSESTYSTAEIDSIITTLEAR